MLEFNRLAIKNAERCKEAFKHEVEDWSIEMWAVAVAGETGEMCNFVKKLKRLQEHLTTPEYEGYTVEEIKKEIGKELADIVIYADLLATRLGMSLGNEVKAKFNKKSDKHKSRIKL